MTSSRDALRVAPTYRRRSSSNSSVTIAFRTACSMSSTATPFLRAEEWISNEHSYYEIRTPMPTNPYRQFDEPIATGSSR